MKTLVSIVLTSFLLASCSIIQGKSSPSQYTTDTAATTQIKSKLVASDMVSAPTIHVETQNGVVQLSGFVTTGQQAQEAERIARQTDGVRDVINDLVVNPKRR